MQLGWAEAANPLRVSGDGWTVVAEGEHGVLTITREGLGTVLQDVRLNLRG